MIVDCTMAAYETDALAVRAAELEDVVDLRVIVYGTETFRGASLELDPLSLVHGTTPTLVKRFDFDGATDPWEREYLLRQFSLEAGRKFTGDSDLFILSDADEIPHPDAVRKAVGPTLLPNDYREWYMDWRAPDQWQPQNQPLIGRWSDYAAAGGAQAAREAVAWPAAQERGWHLSTLGDAAFAARKLSSFAHHEDEVQAHNEMGLLAYRRAAGLDLLDRFELVQTDDLPASAGRFPHLLSRSAQHAP